MALLFTKDELNHAFKVWLAQYLKTNGLTYQEAAKRLKMSVASVGHILTGRRNATLDLVANTMANIGLDYNQELRGLVPGLHLGNAPDVPDSYESEDDNGYAPYMSSDEMTERGFFTVPFSDDMRLAAGSQHAVPFTRTAEDSHIVVHGPSLGRRNAKNLQAFRVGGSSMEPLIADGGIVLADTSHNDLRHLKEGRIYVLCWDLYDGECAIKYLRWADKGKILSIESENPLNKPVFKRVDEVILVGKVIWAWREFED